MASLLAVNDSLGWAFLRWTCTEGEESETEMNRPKAENNPTAARKLFRVSLVKSILSTVYVVLADIAVHALATQLARLCHRFYAR